MGALPVLARRLITVWAFAVAIAAPIGVVVAVTPAEPAANVAQCSGGEEPDGFTTTCVPFMTPKTPGTTATATGAGACPPGVSGTECAPQSDDATNPLATGAERSAAENEQIGEDVAAEVAGAA
jgi:hypothetical protein